MSESPSFSRRLILGNITAFVTGGIASRFLALLAILLIARQIETDAYGQYDATFSNAVLAATLYTIGLDNWLLYRASKESDRLNVFVTATLVIKMTLGVLWFLLILPLTTRLNPEAFPFELVMWAMLSVFFEQIAETVWAAFKVKLKNHWVTAGMLVMHGGFLLLVLLQRELDTEQVIVFMQMRTVATLMGAIASLWWLFRTIGVRWERQVVPRILRETLVFGFSAVLAAIYARADRIIVAQYLGADANAAYAPASSLISTLFIFPQAGYTVLMPILGKVQKDERFGRYMRLSLLVSFLFGVVAAVAVIFLARPLLSLTFGERYLFSAELLPILAWVFALKCMSFAAAAGIVSVGWQNRRVGIQIIAAIFNVVANVLLIEQVGLRGVAWIFVASEAIITVGYLWIMFRWRKQSSQSDSTPTPL